MTADDDKKLAAQAAVDLVADGMILGLGTGSTSVFAIELLGKRMEQGLKIKGVPTSDASAQLAKKVGIPLVTLEEYPILDLDIDGADEVDPSLNLIKGGGGALLHEKIVAAACKQVVIIVDEKKIVERLGKFKLPVEVIPFARGSVEKTLSQMGATAVIRKKDGNIFHTDENNIILDCDFGFIDDPGALSQKLNQVPGIVEHGLFVDLVERVIIGANGQIKTLKKS
jgi:ribose 5-phosphate isomerase A